MTVTVLLVLPMVRCKEMVREFSIGSYKGADKHEVEVSDQFPCLWNVCMHGS